MNGDRSGPPIDEIREARRRISARFDHDPKRLVAYYLERQERHGNRPIDPSKPREATDQSAARLAPRPGIKAS